ncbi:MAG: 16S rRNA (adenine(1518)-N(6)/adenine(1519)-N(6))-dimethyltransferase RsmA [Acidimicrobiales bacterium]
MTGATPGTPLEGPLGPPGRREARQLLEDHGLSPNRALGQHFVVDPNTVRRIARMAAVGPGDHVVEVGAGLGALTLALAGTGAAVTTIEIDRGLVPVLRRLVEPAGVTVVEADAMALDWNALLGTGPRPWVLVANLPYNVATPLIADLLRDVPSIARMLVMVQREAGERLAAGPGEVGYGGVSVRVGYWAEVAVVGRVPASVFLPRPEVESVLVEVKRRKKPAVGDDVDRARLFALIAAGFGQRRKMLRRSLAALVDAEAFVAAGVRPEARAEELDIHAWARLARFPPPG